MRRIFASLAAAALALGPIRASAQFGAHAPVSEAQAQDAYQQAMADYKQALADYQAARAAYDRKYGQGAYDQTHHAPFQPAPPPGRPPGPPPGLASAPPSFAPEDGPPYLGPTCTRRVEDNRASLAAAMANALGAGPASASSKNEGAVLGALIDGTLGVNLATSETSGRRYAPECDPDGFYFSSDQTFPYRESALRKTGNGEHDQQYYFQEGCRLAVAPITTRTRSVEYHYARVCPDRRGRYRFTS